MVITGALLNVILDPVFMFSWGLGMGVEGASLATTVSQFVTFGILTWFYLRGRSVIKIKVKSFHLSWDLIKTVAAPLPNADEIIAAYGVVQRLILPKLLGVTGIYFAQPAADMLTLLICVFSVKSMKRIASANMLGKGDIEKKVEN